MLTAVHNAGAQIYVPRLVLSACQENNDAYDENRAMDLSSIRVLDPRVRDAPGFMPGYEVNRMSPVPQDVFFEDGWWEVAVGM